ncbi:MAG: hypothetical protein IJT73_00010 [Selenomonadaceae bacterium]|nr:hypothetical protein [Selenomonadaceae bacterium]
MSKTKYLVGTFLATALLIGGCFSDEEKPAQNTETQNENQKLAGQRLTDDNGVEYTLIDNGDGTETARYDDGRSVTFRRQEDGSLDYLYGAAGLIAGMAAGYYLFHGFSSPAGTWNAAQNRYTVSEPLKRNDDKNTTAGGAGRVSNNSNTTNSTAANSNSNATNSNSKVNLSKDSTSSSSNAKTGFGSAGTRTPASSAAS